MNRVTDDPVIQNRVIGLEAVSVNFFCVQNVVGLGKEPRYLRRRDKDCTALERREDAIEALFRELGCC